MRTFRFTAISALVFACNSASRSNAVADGVPDANSPIVQDGGLAADDAGAPAALAQCDPAGPAADAGTITLTPGDRAVIDPPQPSGWEVVSTTPDCAAIAPGAVPGMRSWAGPDATKFAPYCDPPFVDGEGNLSAFSLSEAGPITAFVPSDGSAGAVLPALSSNAYVLEFVMANRDTGFELYTSAGGEPCNYLQKVDERGGVQTPPQLVPTHESEHIAAIYRNPRGGFIEALLANRGATVQLRWVDDALNPIGEWHDVITSPTLLLDEWAAYVDQTGKALVLSFMHPRLSAPPDTWKFNAQWMDINGPVGPAFVPIAPVFTSRAKTLFATWGTVVPLPDGGLAMFIPQANPATGGTILPMGWYAYYPSGQSAPAPPPGWLTQYDGSLASTADGATYAALEHAPNTCARSLVLISPSGQTCYRLPLDNSEGCDLTDQIYPDGSLVVRNVCPVRWWPRLARPAD